MGVLDVTLWTLLGMGGPDKIFISSDRGNNPPPLARCSVWADSVFYCSRGTRNRRYGYIPSRCQVIFNLLHAKITY